ncbi:hypothetical protein CPC08DRAFT_217712 [Agrocybe pediades]|nr:hypothetical protein CPC08DRAFT_217712 [Agrocybe pediades]
MMQQCDLLEAWLDRSGPCLPLYLDVEYEYIGNDNFIPQDCTITRRTISILASRLPRWAVVRMRMPFEIYEEFDRLLKPYGSPLMLQALDIRLFDYGQGRASRNQQGIESGRLLVEAPSLRRLSTHCAVWDTLTLSLSSHLTYLDCFFYPFDHQAALELLSRLPLLIECRLTLSSNWDAVEPNMATFLPNLKSLKIIDNGIILCHIKIAFYDCLSMPNLESLSDKRLFSAHPPSMDEIAVTGHPLFFAIHKNKLNLKSLAFAHYGVQGSAIEQVFKNLPSLTRLQLGAVDFYGVPGAYIQHPVNHYEYFDLCALIIDVDDHDRYSQNSRITATSRALPLLPNLTQFVARGIQHISDDTLSQFILSRLDPVANAKRGIATLKLVEVEFARFMEQDIGPVIMQRAKDVGIEDFQLRLEYLPIPEGTVRCVSPFD